MTKPAPRRAVRFKPSLDTLAMIDPSPNVFEPFRPTIYALVHNESSTGAGVVALRTERLLTGQNVRVQIGELAPVVAEVRWRTELDNDVIRLGLMYLTA